MITTACLALMLSTAVVPDWDMPGVQVRCWRTRTLCNFVTFVDGQPESVWHVFRGHPRMVGGMLYRCPRAAQIPRGTLWGPEPEE